jgi:hypothetical protein
VKKERRKTKSDVTLGMALTALVIIVIYEQSGLRAKIGRSDDSKQPNA